MDYAHLINMHDDGLLEHVAKRLLTSTVSINSTLSQRWLRCILSHIRHAPAHWPSS